MVVDIRKFLPASTRTGSHQALQAAGLFLRHTAEVWPVLLSLIVCTTGGTLAGRQSPSFLSNTSQARNRVHPASALNPGLVPATYLPLVVSPDPFLLDLPIWVNTSPPAQSEVTLFRHTFILAATLQEPKLEIFADTRYEVWIDGTFVGRGPARFSRDLREYDVYPLSPLNVGEHLIAVLVQWAPNTRRSESTRPFLQGHIQAKTPDGLKKVAVTGPDWQSLLSDAWRQDATPVHSWDLIGPTELLDLRRLPADWNQPGYQAAGWNPAVVVDSSTPSYQAPQHSTLDLPAYLPEESLNPATSLVTGHRVVYQPRSISFLANVPITPTIFDAGLLSPGYLTGELVPPIANPTSISLNVSHPTTFTLDVLSVAGMPSMAAKVDGNGLAWQKIGGIRRDVYRASEPIMPGAHVLSFTGIPTQGLTFDVSTRDISYSHVPFQQGNNAGRRLLLAEPVSDPAPVVISSTNPTSLEAEIKTPPAYFVLDLGRIVHGRLQAEVQGPPGTIMDIGWDQRLLWGTRRPLPYPGSLHPQWDQVDSWVLDGTNRSISTIDERAGRYVLIAVWGTGPVQLQNLHVDEVRYPLTQNGSFHSSDARLDQIWQTGVDTAYPNMSDAYADPWRERGQWWGDAYVVDHVNRVAFGESGLLKRGLRFMADAFYNSQAPGLAPNNNGLHMLDYAMLWVQSLAEYLQQTKDPQLLSDTYPQVSQFMNHLASYENASTGLLDLPKANWWETVYIEPLGLHSRYGQATAVNALYYGTLLNAAGIAEQAGDPASATAWRKKAAAVKNSLNTHLYLASQHEYLTTIYENTPEAPSPQAQAWALAYDLPPDNDKDQIATALEQLLSPDPSSPNVEIYGMFWVLEALGRAGHIQKALNIIDTYYGHLLDLGATTWWERFNANKDYSASLSHGWGAAPTWFLTTYVLGAQQTGPNTWLVRPALSGVTGASGAIPFQGGTLQVHWEHLDCQSFNLQVMSTDKSSGEIVIPWNGSSLTLTLNGAIAWQNGKAHAENVREATDGIHMALPGGSYNIHGQQVCYKNYTPLVVH